MYGCMGMCVHREVIAALMEVDTSFFPFRADNPMDDEDDEDEDEEGGVIGLGKLFS